MKKFVIDFNTDDSPAISYEDTFRTLVPDRLTTLDALAGLAVGAFAVLLHWLLNIQCLNPAEWSSFAVAAGVRPSGSLFSGIWNFGAHWLFSRFSPDFVYFVFRTAGYIAAELIAVLSYFTFREILSVSIRQFHEKKVWRYIVGPAVAALGAILVSCSDSVWNACESFGPSGLFTVILVMAISAFVHFARCGGRWWLYIAAFLFGVSVGENPVGLVSLIGCIVAYNYALAEARAGDLFMAEAHEDDNFSLPLAYIIGFVGFLVPYFATVYVFKLQNGPEFTGWSEDTVPLRFFFNYVWDFTTKSASFLGWIAGLVVSVVPTALTLWYFHLMMDDDRDTSIGVILIFAASFAVSILQFTFLDQLWVWSLSKNIIVNFKELKCVFHILNAVTVVLAVAAFGMAFCCRGRYVDKKVRRFVQGAFIAAIGIIALLAVASRQSPGKKTIARVVDSYVKEVAKEADGATWIFTDGQFDVGVELASFNRGNRISALSLLADASSGNRYLRQRFARTDEEKLALRDSAAAALKAWKRDLPDNLGRSAIQLGFENWRRGPGDIPETSGLVGRPGGFPPGQAAEGIEETRKLVKSIKEIINLGYFDSCTDRWLKERVTFILWRIARVARIRSTRADMLGDSDLAVAETEFADYVSSLNADYALVNERLGSVGLRSLRHLSPREQLRDALRKADFTMARPYADAILKEDPDNVPANFALAMFYFVEDQFSKAISYFERCIASYPNEPTFYNNMAVALLLSRRYEEAMKHARRALELKPDSPEIKDTVRRIEKELGKTQE